MYFYYLEIIKPFFLTKLNIKKNKNIFLIKNITISIFLKNLSKIDIDSINKSFFLLEYFCKTIPKISFYTQYEYKKRFNNIRCFINLSGFNIYKFLNFFSSFLFFSIKKKNLKLLNNKISSQNIYLFKINDISIFSFLPYIFFNWDILILFKIKFNKINKIGYKTLLNSFNFPF